MKHNIPMWKHLPTEVYVIFLFNVFINSLLGLYILPHCLNRDHIKVMQSPTILVSKDHPEDVLCNETTY